MLVDTHAHINLHAFRDDADEVIRRSLDAGVAVINVGTEFNTSKQAVEMLSRYTQNVFAVVGLHPSHTYENPYLDENESAFVTGQEEFNFEAYKQLAENPKVVGIGECGLDYYRLPDQELGSMNHAVIKKLQKEAFLKQLQLAQNMDKALVIHCRPSKGSSDAYNDVLEILNSVAGSQLSVLRFEIHSFTGSLEVAKKFIELGGYIGLNGILTFDKTGNMEEVVRGVPLDRLVLETDSPYLAPAPMRGKRNEPINVQAVAHKIAEIKNISFEQVARQTTANAVQLFNIAL